MKLLSQQGRDVLQKRRSRTKLCEEKAQFQAQHVSFIITPDEHNYMT